VIAIPAAAADMAAKAPPPASALFYNWTGFYFGGHTGYGWDGDRRGSYTPNDPAANLFTCGGAAGGTCVPAATFGISGGLLGIEAGYNWQPTARWVVGVESDFSLTAISGSGTSNFLLAGGASTFQATENVDWFGTVRGRLGWLAADNFSLCGTGGLAYGHVKTSATLSVRLAITGRPAPSRLPAPLPLALLATRRRRSADTLRVAASPTRFRPM
jgi:outer membrane immunogenic protein